jgi:hypothetical protein
MASAVGKRKAGGKPGADPYSVLKEEIKESIREVSRPAGCVCS